MRAIPCLFLSACVFGTSPVFDEVSPLPEKGKFAFAIDLSGTDITEVTYSWDVLYTGQEPDPTTWSSQDGTPGPSFLLPNPPENEAVFVAGLTDTDDWLCSVQEDGTVTTLGSVTSWVDGQFTFLSCVEAGDVTYIASAWGTKVNSSSPPIEQNGE